MNANASPSTPSLNLPPFIGLVNRRLVVPAASGNTVTVERHLFGQLMAMAIDSIYLDEKYYCEKYPDVGQMVKSGALASAKEHYLRFGYFENRLPYRILVDEEWYLSTYPDIGAAVDREDFESGQAHFEDSGFREGRLPFQGFQLRGA